ncbi:MAG TPA: glycosyltransferase [Chloroflexota bacterium]|nr:glycosyltransferase [Chloroflexota bacterium]
MEANPHRRHRGLPRGAGRAGASGTLAWAALAVGLAAVSLFQGLAWRRDRARALGLRLAGEQPRPRLAATPRVSILVAAWNEAGMIDAHLRSVVGLRYPNLEYVLAAGGADGTYRRASAYAGPGVVVLEQRPGEGKQGALRRCLARASGEILYFTDADCLLDDDSFERTVAPLVNEREMAATGTAGPLPEQLATNDFVRGQWAVWFYRSPSIPTYTSGLLGRNAAVHRRALLESEALAYRVTSGTDRFLAGRLTRAGYRIRYVGSSWIRTAYETSYPVYVRQQSRWLRNLVEHGIRFHDRADVLHGARTMFVAMAALALSLACLTLGPPGWALLVPFIVHLALTRARYLAFASVVWGERWSVPWLKLPFYAYLDLFAWGRAMLQLLFPRLGARW